MQTAALPVGERERAPLTLPPRRYPRGVARPRHARRPTPLLRRSSSARSPASPLLHRNTSPNAVVYSWSTHQLLGHPRGLAGVSEVRKAQTYGRDPRNGHSHIEGRHQGMLKPAAVSWARSRPCVVVGAEPAVHRRGRGSDHAAPAGLDYAAAAPPLAEAFETEACFGVLPALSSSSPVVDVAPGGAPPPRRRRARVPRRAARRPSTASRRTSPRRPRACCSVARPSSINVRRRPARRSTTSTSSRATSVGLASVARLLYALVAPGLAYIRCVENADDPRPVLELPVGPQNAPFCSFRCRASERSMCGAWGGCEKARFGEVQFGAAASARRWRRRQCAKYFLC